LGMVDPCIIQRLLMGKTGKQLRDQYFIISVFDPYLQLTLLLIGLSGVILLSTDRRLETCAAYCAPSTSGRL